jgi:hypothetical protein
MPGTLTDLYLESRAVFSRAQVERLSGAPAGEHPMRGWLLALEQSTPDRPLSFISIAGMTTYMRDTLLRDTDQMSMANGLEARVPFLDVAFARTVLSFPHAVKCGRGHERETAGGESLPPSVTKPLLVKAFADRIPVVLHGLPKKGFSLPMRQWMCGPLREYCLDGFGRRRCATRGSTGGRRWRCGGRSRTTARGGRAPGRWWCWRIGARGTCRDFGLRIRRAAGVISTPISFRWALRDAVTSHSKGD